MAEDYYEILGITPGVGTREIASAYRALALKYHPDKNAGNPKALSAFHAINKAYQILMDPEARAAFDVTVQTKRAQKERQLNMEDRRRRMRDELVQREREARERKGKEGEIKPQMARPAEKYSKEFASSSTSSPLERTFKMVFSNDENEDLVISMLEKYGKIESYLKRGKLATIRMAKRESIQALLDGFTAGLLPGISSIQPESPQFSSDAGRQSPETIDTCDIEEYEVKVLAKLYNKAIQQQQTELNVDNIY